MKLEFKAEDFENNCERYNLYPDLAAEIANKILAKYFQEHGRLVYGRELSLAWYPDVKCMAAPPALQGLVINIENITPKCDHSAIPENKHLSQYVCVHCNVHLIPVAFKEA